jgi:hypothetical protein
VNYRADRDARYGYSRKARMKLLLPPPLKPTLAIIQNSDLKNALHNSNSNAAAPVALVKNGASVET